MTKFTEDELNSITEIQSKYHTLGIGLVQVEVAKKALIAELDKLEDSEKQMKKEILETSNAEKILSEELSKKYGVGTIDLQSGVFEPQKQT